MIRFTLGFVGGLLASAIASGMALAGPEKVEFPMLYDKTFTKIGPIDRHDNNTVRIMYANQAAMAAEPDKPIPSGAVLLLEVRPVKMDSAGKPMRDAEGRLVPDPDKIASVNVQEKRTGWAAEYDEKVRNPGWEYAVFDPNGTRRTTDTQPCMACHKPRVADDYTFVFAQVIRDLKAKK